jgi:uncharacterized protein
VVSKGRRVVRVLAENGVAVCDRCEVADGPIARMRGLLGRDGLEPGAGMLMTREPSVHTFFMRFPIDVVFLDKQDRIVKVVHDLRPWRFAGARRAAAVLELPAGTAATAGLEPGMTLTRTTVDGGAPE